MYRLELDEAELIALGEGARCLETVAFRFEEKPPKGLVDRNLSLAKLLLYMQKRAFEGGRH